MVKSAGFLKKLKKIGNLFGKGANWINNNIVKPLNPIIDTALDFVPGGGVIKGIKNTASNFLDNQYGTNSDNRITNFVSNAGDYFLDTQRLPSEGKKYINYDEYSNEEEYIPPPRKTYKNPFGKRIN